MKKQRKTFKCADVIAEESARLVERRKKLFGKEAADKFEENKFGIALSGGGIRSAIINLGFLKTMNAFKILEKADYLSTVSGGGYTGSYIQATLKNKGSYEHLFDRPQIEYMRKHGDYMIPGQTKLSKSWNTLVLIISYLSSWAMSLLSPAIVFFAGFLIYKMVVVLKPFNFEGNAKEPVIMALLVFFGVWVIHFIADLIFNFNLEISRRFSKIESLVAGFILLTLLVVFLINLDESQKELLEKIDIPLVIGGLAAVLLFGLFVNPNSLSFHRFYRNQLANAFLFHAGECKNMRLKDLFNPSGKKADCLAPYPLINTCLNLQNAAGDEKFKGVKANDYFLLSPLFCGAKLTNYVSTSEFPGFRQLTLPAATTISAAAVNPGMGRYSNKLLSILITLVNAGLGFWVNNPLKKDSNFVVWWPNYFFKELFSKIDTANKKLNISDGGHIENLGVYELLRRKCRLIIAVDAGADPKFNFTDLENLTIRARNELGMDIHFRKGNDHEDCIRPKPSSGYSNTRFAIADLIKIWEEFDLEDENGQPYTFKKKMGGKEREVKVEALVNYFYKKNDLDYLKFRVDIKVERGIDLPEKMCDKLEKRAREMVRQNLRQNRGRGRNKIKTGTFVYVKSAVTAPRKPYISPNDSQGDKNLKFDTFKYKIYHPVFPHESTADQFFDPVQWESYFQLGQFIAADVLKTKRLAAYQAGIRKPFDISIDDLIRCFDEDANLFPEIEPEDKLIDMCELKEEAEAVEIAERSLQPPTEKEKREDVDVGYAM